MVILSSLPTAQNVYNYAATYQRGMVVNRDTVLLSTFLDITIDAHGGGSFSADNQLRHAGGRRQANHYLTRPERNPAMP